MGDLSAHSRRTDLGLRLFTGERSLLSTALCVLSHRTEISQRDNDGKFGSCFTRVATTSGIEILTTPVHAPRANAICERFMRSVRQECLDHLLILQEKQLQRVLKAYVSYFNQARPHQGIGQQLPVVCGVARPTQHAADKVIAVPILGGLHHDYRKVA